jgi:hypothetical protein
MVSFHHTDDTYGERAANDKECDIPSHCRFLRYLRAGSDPLPRAADVEHEIPMSSKPLSSRPSRCRQSVSCRLMSAQRKPLWV